MDSKNPIDERKNKSKPVVPRGVLFDPKPFGLAGAWHTHHLFINNHSWRVKSLWTRLEKLLPWGCLPIQSYGYQNVPLPSAHSLHWPICRDFDYVRSSSLGSCLPSCLGFATMFIREDFNHLQSTSTNRDPARLSSSCSTTCWCIFLRQRING